MARKLRMIADGSYQHLIQRGNNKNKVFHRHDEHLIYLGLIARYLPEFALELHHYCLMPNHVHMLVRAVRGRDVSAFMKLVTQTYTNRYKLRRGYFGALWQGRFQNVEIASDDQLLRCARYIERNPLAAGLVKKLDDYPHNSFAYYARGARNAIITRGAHYERFGKTDAERRARFRFFVESADKNDGVYEPFVR